VQGVGGARRFRGNEHACAAGGHCIAAAAPAHVRFYVVCQHLCVVSVGTFMPNWLLRGSHEFAIRFSLQKTKKAEL
jgi:hypothetical protein